jgi:hypothetical protein
MNQSSIYSDWIQYKPTESYISYYLIFLSKIGICTYKFPSAGDGVYRRVGDRIEIRVLLYSAPSLHNIVPLQYRHRIMGGTLNYDHNLGIASAVVRIAGW